MLLLVALMFQGGGQPACLPTFPEVQEMLVPDWDSILITSEPGISPEQEQAWDSIIAYAALTEPTCDWVDIENTHDVWTFANALVYAGSGNTSARTKVTLALNQLITEFAFANPAFVPANYSIIGACRNTLSYVLAADTIDLETVDPTLYADFCGWLEEARLRSDWANNISGGDGCKNKNIAGCHDARPNNHGNYCGASAIAIGIYLQNATYLCARMRTFRGFVGDTTYYNGFIFHSNDSWHVDSSNKRGINPACNGQCSGGELNGSIPDDQRRVADCGLGDYPAAYGFTTGYAWETMQGLVMQAHLLSRCGFQSYAWQSSAIDRAIAWLYDIYSYPPNELADCNAGAAFDDRWVPHITNKVYGTTHPVEYGLNPGKNCGFADWWSAGL
jgi:hypothetical protein